MPIEARAGWSNRTSRALESSERAITNAQEPWSEAWEEDVDFPLGRLRGVRAVDQVLGELDGQIAPDGSWRRLPGIGDTHQRAHHLVGVLGSLDDHQHRG